MPLHVLNVSKRPQVAAEQCVARDAAGAAVKLGGFYVTLLVPAVVPLNRSGAR